MSVGLEVVLQEYMQGWYSEYCNKTGQFCDQVKLKHSTKDGQTGKEIIYHVKSSSGYVPASTPDYNQDDINISYLLSQTTTIKPTTGRVLKKKRKTKLVDRLKKMFAKLEQKYKHEKKKIALAPIEFLKKEKTLKRPQPNTAVKVAQEESNLSHNSDYDEFFDFVPMEYEAVEDIVIENYWE